MDEIPDNSKKKIPRQFFIESKKNDISDFTNFTSTLKINETKTIKTMIYEDKRNNFLLKSNNEESQKKKKIKTYKTLSDINLEPNKRTPLFSFSSNIDNDLIEKEYLIIQDINIYINNDLKEGLFFGNTLIFNENGLKYGLRGKKDGFGFFGTSTHFHGKIINDFVLNIKYPVFNKKKNPLNLNNNENETSTVFNIKDLPAIYFTIFFESFSKKYFFKSMRIIDYDKIDNFEFLFAIYKKEKTYKLKIERNLIINFNENNFQLLFIKLLDNYTLKLYSINLYENTITIILLKQDCDG